MIKLDFNEYIIYHSDAYGCTVPARAVLNLSGAYLVAIQKEWWVPTEGLHTLEGMRKTLPDNYFTPDIIDAINNSFPSHTWGLRWMHHTELVVSRITQLPQLLTQLENETKNA